MTDLKRGITTSAGFKKALEERVPGATIEPSMTAGELLNVFTEIDENITFQSTDDDILTAVNGDTPTPTPTITIDFNIADSVDLLGKVASDLQEGVTEASGDITGTLKYVTDYTGFSGEPELQEGNFLALHVNYDGEEDVYVELLNGISGPVKLDEDRIIILRIADKDTQSIKVTAGDLLAAYDIDGLTITPASNNDEQGQE